MTTHPQPNPAARPRALAEGFPIPGRRVEHAFRELDKALYGSDEEKKALGSPRLLARPWDPPTCVDPKLRSELWQWLDRVVTWLNHEYVWDVSTMIPACWPKHPHLVHEVAVLADLRRRAGQALTGDAMEEWHRYALPAFIERMRQRMKSHCEDKDLTGDGVMSEGYVSTVLGLKGIPRAAENVGTARNILLAMTTGCRLHILHVSTKESVEIIRHAKSFGAPITCETCPQYVALTDEACLGYDTNAKMSPPLRTKADQEAIIEGLRDGTIDAIATDHAPHAPHEKEQEFARAPFGMLGLETSLGLVVTHLVKPGVLTLSQMVEKMSLVPAQILGVPAGTLSVGAAADITVFDPDAEWTVDVNKFKSKSRNSVLDGVLLTGRAITTFVGGRQIIL